MLTLVNTSRKGLLDHGPGRRVTEVRGNNAACEVRSGRGLLASIFVLTGSGSPVVDWEGLP